MGERNCPLGMFEGASGVGSATAALPVRERVVILTRAPWAAVHIADSVSG